MTYPMVFSVTRQKFELTSLVSYCEVLAITPEITHTHAHKHIQRYNSLLSHAFTSGSAV